MTQEDKELLFKDLCARLPYHVKCKIWLKDGTTEEGLLDLQHNYGNVLQDAFYYDKIKDIKPYLRPMSSMTDEERKEIGILIKENRPNPYGIINNKGIDNLLFSVSITSGVLIDWINARHFDYRGLIEKDLAIEAPKGMDNIS